MSSHLPSTTPSPSATAVSSHTASPHLPSSSKWAFALPKEENEKLPGPGPSASASSSRHARSASIPVLPSLGFGLNRRRRLVTVLAVLGIVCSGYIWVNGVPSAIDWTTTVPLTPSPIADSSPSPAPTSGSTPISDVPPSEEMKIHPNWPDTTPPTPLQIWGTDLSSQRLLNGLSPWPPNPPISEDQPPLSQLGRTADEVYNLGPMTFEEYRKQMEEFVDVAFPRGLAKSLRNDLEMYLDTGDVSGEGRERRQPWDVAKRIWQTDKDEARRNDPQVRSWREGGAIKEGWEWELVTDEKAEKYVKKYLKDSTIAMVWEYLPTGILRADMLRYLLLYLEGGLYTDTDTKLLKPPSKWGQGAKLWRDGAGWLDEVSIERIGNGEAVEDVLGRPSVLVGVEADVGSRGDWHDWWPRPIQIVQWTLTSAPAHPIPLNALLRITHATAQAIDWSHDHASTVKILKDSGRYDDAKKLLETDVTRNVKDGGPLGVMDWTGPGVWTDAVLSYLRVKYGVLWTDLRDITEPLRIGDVVILPVTGFSPGVGNFGSKPHWDRQAMVEHGFRGSWKSDSDPK